MNQYRIRLRGQRFDVRVLSDPRAEEVEVEVNGEALTVRIEAVRDTSRQPGTPAEKAVLQEDHPPADGKAALPSSDLVTAPLPGLLKSVSVQAGDEVKLGQVLLVIEAMKMDNLLRASRAGVVREVHAAPGTQVAHGDALLSYEAA